jgi:hypothetical protein
VFERELMSVHNHVEVRVLVAKGHLHNTHDVKTFQKNKKGVGHYLARFRRANAACFAAAYVVIWGRQLTENNNQPVYSNNQPVKGLGLGGNDNQPEWRAASPRVLGDCGPLVLQHSFARDRNTHRLRVYKGHFELGESAECHVGGRAAVAVRSALHAACSQQRRGLNLQRNTRQAMVR